MQPNFVVSLMESIIARKKSYKEDVSFAKQTLDLLAQSVKSICIKLAAMINYLKKSRRHSNMTSSLITARLFIRKMFQLRQQQFIYFLN